MAKHEGWDSELFVEPPSEDDLCNICCGVLEDAVETGCGHSFCEKCIKEWLEQRQVCPQDQKPLSWADCRPMIRDRRRILDLKVKCPWCETIMELRQLREHKKLKCLKKPADYEEEEEEEEEPKAEEKAAEEPEYVIEFAAGGEGGEGDADRKAAEEKKIEEERRAREQKEAEERDRRFAQQMQEQERARGLSVRPASPHRASQQPRNQGSPSVQLVRPGPAVSPIGEVGGEPHVEEFGQPNNNNGVMIEYYQADEFAGGEGGFGEGQEGQPDYRGANGKNGLRPIPPKRSGCCGCSDRCWCCMCCFFWILLLILGVSIWFFGVSGTVQKVGL